MGGRGREAGCGVKVKEKGERVKMGELVCMGQYVRDCDDGVEEVWKEGI